MTKKSLGTKIVAIKFIELIVLSSIPSTKEIAAETYLRTNSQSRAGSPNVNVD